MEINFETKTVKAYRESFHQIKRTQLSLESVVPDVSDDIGRLYSVQPSVLLKSKDLTTRGASVTGELTVALLYINELETQVFDLHLTQSFSLEFEMSEPDPEMLTQIRLFISNSEARTLNPRKVSVTVETGGELSGYSLEDYSISADIPDDGACKICTKRDRAESALINAVCEKTFVINEQFPFSGSKPAPERLISESTDFRIADCQLIGSKVLMKGSVCVSICYHSDAVDYPVSAEFTAPFSQLADIGQEIMDLCSVQIEPTSVYFSLVDTIGGEKALDAEIHAVAQIVSRVQQAVDYISDAYSSRLPSDLTYEAWPLLSCENTERLLLESDERIELPGDCEDVLTVLSSLGACSMGRERGEAAVNLDVLYRSAGGSLASARRMLSLSEEYPQQEVILSEARLLDSYFRPNGHILNGRISVELLYMKRAESEIQSVVSMSLNEEAPFDSSRFATVTAVRVDRESVWDLAKQYHSNCEEIEALNEINGPIRGRMLLIPKCQ